MCCQNIGASTLSVMSLARIMVSIMVPFMSAARHWIAESNNDQCNMFIYVGPKLGIQLRHILVPIAARLCFSLTSDSSHGLPDPLAAESLENMNNKSDVESQSFLTYGF